jgi:hypothetical protein
MVLEITRQQFQMMLLVGSKPLDLLIFVLRGLRGISKCSRKYRGYSH